MPLPLPATTKRTIEQVTVKSCTDEKVMMNERSWRTARPGNNFVAPPPSCVSSPASKQHQLLLLLRLRLLLRLLSAKIFHPIFEIQSNAFTWHRPTRLDSTRLASAALLLSINQSDHLRLRTLSGQITSHSFVFLYLFSYLFILKAHFPCC